MVNKERHKSSRIPVHFADEEKNGGDDPSSDITGQSPLEDEPETQGRVEQGADDNLSESSNATESSMRFEQEEEQSAAQSAQVKPVDEGQHISDAGESDSAQQKPSAKDGPAFAELLATRAELKRVQAEIEKLTEERQEMFEKVARRQADFDNYRKRVERERGETYNRVAVELVSQLLPVLDNLQRAVDAESSLESGESNEFRHFLRGVELIGKQLNGVLENLGVKPVPTVGQPFDPHVHEAVATEASEEFEPDIVSTELVRGYQLGDKLIRPAMVKVVK